MKVRGVAYCSARRIPRWVRRCPWYSWTGFVRLTSQAALATTLLGSTVFVATSPEIWADDKAAKPRYQYAQHIEPILKTHCVRCHQGADPQGGLDLSHAAGLLVGGGSGAAIRIGAAELSVLYERITAVKEHAVGASLTLVQRGIIRTWINQGAQGVGNAASGLEEDAHDAVDSWAFQPPVRPTIPSVNAQHRVRNPIEGNPKRGWGGGGIIGVA